MTRPVFCCLSFLLLGAPIAAGEIDLFDGDKVWPVQIEVRDAEMDRLRKSPRKYVPAKVTVAGQEYHECGVQLKGQGTFKPVDDQPSLTLDFNKYRVEQRLAGLSKIHLNNSLQDRTFVKEKLGSEIFRSAGMAAPRVTHAEVFLNGRNLGLYVLKEGFTEEFLQRHFSSADGSLYDPEGALDIDGGMDLKIGKKQDDLLKTLAEAARTTDFEQRRAGLDRYLAVDSFIAFLAMEVLISHWDGYALGQNNYRVYIPPEDRKVVFLPGGMDQIFSKADAAWQPEMSGLLGRALLDLPEGRRTYRQQFQRLLTDHFDPDYLTRRAGQISKVIRGRLPRGEARESQLELEELCGRIKARQQSLLQQLAEPALELLRFDNGIAELAGWKAVDAPLQGAMTEEAMALVITAGPRTSASWRTQVLLPRGKYRFTGLIETSGVIPLPFGAHHGACLKIAGRAQRSEGVTGGSAAKKLIVEFEVKQPEEQIGLICELRAAGGTVRFDKSSLKLARVDQP